MCVWYYILQTQSSNSTVERHSQEQKEKNFRVCRISRFLQTQFSMAFLFPVFAPDVDDVDG